MHKRLLQGAFNFKLANVFLFLCFVKIHLSDGLSDPEILCMRVKRCSDIISYQEGQNQLFVRMKAV